MYDGDYGCLPLMGRFSGSKVGKFRDYSSHKTLYTDYFNGKLDPTDSNNIPRFKQNGLVGAYICPSTQRSDFWNVCYGFYGGSPSNSKVDILRLMSAHQKAKTNGGQPSSGSSPALWGDRCNVSYENVANNGGYIEINHKRPSSYLPSGGNVVTTDGSVAWFSYQGAAAVLVERQFQINLAVVGSNYIAIPSNSVLIGVGSGANFDEAVDATGVALGGNYQPFGNIF
jgi:hypothetical protein